MFALFSNSATLDAAPTRTKTEATERSLPGLAWTALAAAFDRLCDQGDAVSKTDTRPFDGWL